MSGGKWEDLPEHIVVQAFSYLPLSSRYHASLTCKSWNACFESHYLWEKFSFQFMSPEDARYMTCVLRYGHLLRDVSVQIDQELSINRENACRVLQDLAKFNLLQKLRIKFIGENPYFYAGLQFIDALKLLFLKVQQVDSEGEDTQMLANCITESNASSILNTQGTNVNHFAPNDDISESGKTTIGNNINNQKYIRDIQNTVHTQNEDSVEENQQTNKRKADTSESQSKRLKLNTDASDDLEAEASTSAAHAQSLFVPECDETSNLSNNSIYVHLRQVPTEGQLRDVDLSGLSVCMDDSLISLLATYHPLLEKLNIQNKVLVVKVSQSCILNVVANCRKLRDLRVYMCSMSSAALECFAEADRAPLQHLSLFCRREEKYGKELADSVWSEVVRALPRLRVTLIFDHTCPLFRINEIMKPPIPVTVLRLETFTYIYDEVRQAANYYPHCLETLVLETPLSRNSPELNAALVLLAEQCTRLRSLHVFCVIERGTVERILELRPALRENNSYTLKYTQEPHPWFAGKDCL